MQAQCKRDCTILGHRFVEKGEIMDISDPDVPWAKHFVLPKGGTKAKAVKIGVPSAKPKGTKAK